MLKVTRNKDFSDKVHYRQVHGKFPYKVYLELKGNSKYGRYIVIVGNKPLIVENESVSIKVGDNNNINRNIIGLNQNGYITYKVREVNIFEVDDTQLYVFEEVGERK